MLVVRDRNGATADFRLASVSANDIEPALKPLLAPAAILCTDDAAIYAIASKHLGVMHRPVNLAKGIRERGAYHIQNANTYVR